MREAASAILGRLGRIIGREPPREPYAGTYLLRTVNGAELPAKVVDTDRVRIRVVAGRMTLNPDGTWTNHHVLQEWDGARTVTTEQAYHGAYVRTDGRFRFTDNEGDTSTGVVTSDALAVLEGGVLAVYRREAGALRGAHPAPAATHDVVM